MTDEMTSDLNKLTILKDSTNTFTHLSPSLRILMHDDAKNLFNRFYVLHMFCVRSVR